MKKNILIALFALLAVALNGNAQNNTYNMVIEMVNGSKITIGPNDVKNISFIRVHTHTRSWTYRNNFIFLIILFDNRTCMK